MRIFNDDRRQMTIAYLTLPDDGQNEASYETDVAQHNWELGHAKALKLGAMLTHGSLRRFPRTLKLLDLEVHPSNPTSSGTLASSDSGLLASQASDVECSGGSSADSVDAVDKEAPFWPQLTVLTRCEVGEPDYQ
jgi:hypothetical protein